MHTPLITFGVSSNNADNICWYLVMVSKGAFKVWPSLYVYIYIHIYIYVWISLFSSACIIRIPSLNQTYLPLE
jgi:hypothetical protein